MIWTTPNGGETEGKQLTSGPGGIASATWKLGPQPGPQTARGADLAADQLNGGAGNDQLWIGDGNDSATSGSGMDTFGFRFSNPMTPLAAGTGAAFASITDFAAASDTLAFDMAGLGSDAAGANFADGSGGVAGGSASSFYSGAASGSNGERVVVLTDQGFASGALAVQAAQDAGLKSACHVEGGMRAWEKVMGVIG